MIYFDWSRSFWIRRWARLIVHGFCSGFFTLTKHSNLTYFIRNGNRYRLPDQVTWSGMFYDKTWSIRFNNYNQITLLLNSVSFSVFTFTASVNFSCAQMLQCWRRTWHLHSFLVSAPGDLTAQESPPSGICHPRPKKCYSPGVSPGRGGWAQLEMSDALYNKKS